MIWDGIAGSLIGALVALCCWHAFSVFLDWRVERKRVRGDYGGLGAFTTDVNPFTVSGTPPAYVQKGSGHPPARSAGVLTREYSSRK